MKFFETFILIQNKYATHAGTVLKHFFENDTWAMYDDKVIKVGNPDGSGSRDYLAPMSGYVWYGAAVGSKVKIDGWLFTMNDGKDQKNKLSTKKKCLD